MNFISTRIITGNAIINNINDKSYWNSFFNFEATTVNFALTKTIFDYFYESTGVDIEKDFEKLKKSEYIKFYDGKKTFIATVGNGSSENFNNAKINNYTADIYTTVMNMHYQEELNSNLTINRIRNMNVTVLDLIRIKFDYFETLIKGEL